MIIKQLIDEDFSNYKKASMFIGFPTCSWKCEKECGKKVCQNGTLANSPSINIPSTEIVKRYVNNQITKAVVIGGLEPFDSVEDLKGLICEFRAVTDDDIVIYTGYKREEVNEYIDWLKRFKNIIVKFGRFIPDQENRYDDILGVYLASNNQQAEQIS